MKFPIPFFVSFLILLTPLYAGSMTLTTYYPAPSGNYNKIAANYVQMGESALNDIKEQYKCSYERLSGLPACPAGLNIYNKDAHTIFISDGTHRKSVETS